MTVENKESVYFKMDRDNAIRSFGDQLCGDDTKRGDVFFASCSKYFAWDGGRLFFLKADGSRIPAVDAEVKKFFEEGYKFLLPPPPVEEHEFNGGTVKIDPAIIEDALGGSITAKGKIAVAFGEGGGKEAPQTELFLKAEAKRGSGQQRDDKGKFAANDPHADDNRATNPFSRAGWNLTAQGAVAKRDPDLAARLAKSAGVTLGATHPVQ